MGLLDGLLREPAGSALGRGQAGVSSDQVGALIKSVLDSLGGASSTAPPPAAAKAAAPRTYTVLAGDNLSKIAKKFYGEGQLVNEQSTTIAPTGPAYSEFHIAKPDGWPAGTYKVEILADGTSVASKNFEVK